MGNTAFWLNEKGIANVISLKTQEKKFHMMYSSNVQGRAFVCKTPEGEIVFERCPMTSFPYIDLDQHKSKAAAMLVQTIRQNLEGYTHKEVELAILAKQCKT